MEEKTEYLRKTGRVSGPKLILGAVLVLAAVLLAVFLKLFVIGYPSDAYSITDADVNGEELSVGGTFYDSASVYSRHKLIQREEGMTDLVIYACLPSAWNREGTFNLHLNLAKLDSDLNINGMTVHKDGTIISRLANELYTARNPYVGDVSANGEIARLLRISDSLGAFENELQTDEEPYGWSLNFGGRMINAKTFDLKMEEYSCILIALIDNLGEVSWNYTVGTQDGREQRSRTLTEADCSELLGTPVKGFSDSPEDIQKLLDITISP